MFVGDLPSESREHEERGHEDGRRQCHEGGAIFSAELVENEEAECRLEEIVVQG